MSEKQAKTKEKKPKSKAAKIIEWILTGLFLAIFAVIGIGQINGLVDKKNHYNQQLMFGFATFVVGTNSMEPLYKVDSAIITFLEDSDKIYDRYQKGETIDVTFYDCYTANTSYTNPTNHPELAGGRTNALGYPITHRVMEIHVSDKPKGQGKYTFIVAGINNGEAAAVNSEGKVCQYQAFTEKELLGRVIVGSDFLGKTFKFVTSIWGLLILLLIPAFYLVITSVIDIFKAYKEPDEAPAIANEAPVIADSKENKGNVELSEEDKKRLKEELLAEMLNKKGK